MSEDNFDATAMRRETLPPDPERMNDATFTGPPESAEAEASFDAAVAEKFASRTERMISAAGDIGGNIETGSFREAWQETSFLISRGWDAAENLSERAARAVDIALGAVIGFFVDEPKITGAQAHDILQASGNVETIHAREVAAAGYVDAAEHETRMMLMKSEQETGNIRLAETFGGNVTAEATLDIDEQVQERRLTLSR